MQLITRFKASLTALLLALTMLAPVLAMPTVYADVDTSKSYACQGIGLASGGKGCGGGDDARVSDLLSNIVNILSVVVGVAAVIMIVVAGFKYITSGGDANNVAAAKKTIIYAIVGLIIVALAQFIVHFVLGNV
ncbi:MAG: rane protein of unknown function [Candidatus Saccharibacteria bacterium]|nr:rane protein of unknown function [Candidatus Saccharibacteria bacterium]